MWDLLAERKKPLYLAFLHQTLVPAHSLPLQPVLHYLLAPESLVDGEAPVAVHGEENDLARMVEPGSSGHVHPPLPGGHD